jgi:hypothetical protein
MHCRFVDKYLEVSEHVMCVGKIQFLDVKASGIHSSHSGDSLVVKCPSATALANLQNDRFEYDFSNSLFALLCKDRLDTGTVDPCHIQHANEDLEISSIGTLSHTVCTGVHYWVIESVLLLEFLM